MTSVVDLLYSTRLRTDDALGNIERFGVRLARRIDWGDWRPGRSTVLCLGRSIFRDIAPMRQRGAFNWIRVSTNKIRRTQERWVAPEHRRQTYFHHLLETKLRRDKSMLVRFAVAFLETATKMHPIDAILAGNVDHWQEEVVKVACRQLGIPFLALPRETHAGRRFADSKFRFRGSGVAVLSETTRRMLVGAGFPKRAVWALAKESAGIDQVHAFIRSFMEQAGTGRPVAARRHTRKLAAA